MASEVTIPGSNRSSGQQSEEPTDRALLQIQASPPTMTLRSEGTVTTTMVLGVIGPGITIAAGHFAALPAWAITLICALQIIGAVIRHRT